ncbi:cobalt ECF transporter T component CbiQ [Clostridia bacterium]|nr:cobalt ECF transporter T component CbiQ [Clostridia bacterium]
MNILQAAVTINRMEDLAAGNSAAHRLHPLAKIFVTLTYVALVVSVPREDAAGLLPFAPYPVVLMIISKTPWKPLLGRMAVALPFSLFGGLSNLIFMPFPAGAWSFASIMVKTALTVLAVLILIATTEFHEIAAQLAAVKIPKIFCLQLAQTYRYISVLLGEAIMMFTAYRLRAGGKAVKMRDMGGFLGQLILRSVDRAERVYRAMKCRGFDGAYRVTFSAPRVSDVVFAVLTAAALIFMRVGVGVW